MYLTVARDPKDPLPFPGTNRVTLSPDRCRGWININRFYQMVSQNWSSKNLNPKLIFLNNCWDFHFQFFDKDRAKILPHFCSLGWKIFCDDLIFIRTKIKLGSKFPVCGI